MALVAVIGCGGDGGSGGTDPAPKTKVATAVSILSGGGQSMTVGKQLLSRVVVAVKDQTGATMPGVTVAWATSNGTITPGNVITDGAGESGAVWVLGTTAGDQTVTATVAGLPPATFHATGTADIAATVSLSPTTMSVNIDSTKTLTVTQTDKYGNPSSSSVSWFSSTAFADVSSAGVVKGLNVGSAIITATTFVPNGPTPTGTATVTVVSPPWLVTDVKTSGGMGNCGVAANGDGYCWSAGQQKPLLVPGGIKWASISPSIFHICGVATDGKGYCWGGNGTGRLGDGTTTDRTSPTLVSGGLVFSIISPGMDHTCGLTTSGNAYCWGDNFFRTLGNGSTVNSTVPVAVSGARTYTAISAGNTHTCAVATSTAAYCWGNDNNGELGIGVAQSSQSTPVIVQSNVGFTAIIAVGHQTCALASNGTAYCWGVGGSMLGNGGSTQYNLPNAVSGGLSFSKLSTNENSDHMCALTSGGSAYCWGQGLFGAIGDSTETERFTPVAVNGNLTFSSISTGGYGTCAKTTAGAAYCWGDVSAVVNEGTRTKRSQPRPVRNP